MEVNQSYQSAGVCAYITGCHHTLALQAHGDIGVCHLPHLQVQTPRLMALVGVTRHLLRIQSSSPYCTYVHCVSPATVFSLSDPFDPGSWGVTIGSPATLQAHPPAALHPQPEIARWPGRGRRQWPRAPTRTAAAAAARCPAAGKWTYCYVGCKST